MAEIAGSIVGIISLSIQLYDKLNKYANGVKDAKDKAEQITAELYRFSDLLEELEVIISNLNPTARVNSTRIGITACADAIDKVKEKLNGKTPSGGSKTPIKLKSLLKRLSFPFRESDINYWKDTLNSIQLHFMRKHTLCTCRGQTTVTKLLQWPFSVVRARTSSHERQCPFWLRDDVSSKIDVKFSICSVLLGRKMRVALALLHEGGGYSVQSSLICHRVVKTSPAFEYIESLSKNNDWVGESAYKTLYQMFQAREASPYDRTPNGRTLLHHMSWTLCSSVSRKDVSKWNYLLAHILPICKKVAFEREEKGLTCCEYLFLFSTAGNTILVTMLNYGLQLSNSMTDLSFHKNDDVVEINFKNFDDPFDGIDKVTESVLYRSEEGLERSLLETPNEDIGEVPFISLLEFSSLSGWVEGCAQLVSIGAFENMKRNQTSRARELLRYAIDSGNVQMVCFWLGVRENVDQNALNMIGNPQDALKFAYNLYGDSEMFQAVLDYIIHWRLQLRHLADSESIKFHHDETKKLFDFNVEYVIKLLIENGNSLP
ncbi:hypothetical protein BS50DRAFT_449097, partial [Corynespora cassiicola Philippines]